MDQKTRLLNAVNRQAIDRRPFICPGGMMNMAVTEVMEAGNYRWPDAHLDPHVMARLTLAANRLAGIENVGVPFCMTVEAEAMGARVDIGSLEIEPSILVYPMDGVTDVDRLTNLDLNTGRVNVCIKAVQMLRREVPDVPVFANLTGPVSLATSLLEPLKYYRALINEKSAAHELMKLITHNLKAFGRALIKAGADVVCIADPSASGELIGKRAFSEFALPYINELVNCFRKEFGTPSIVHICGKVQSLGTSLSAIAAECISVDSVVSIAKLKQLAPSKITMGNVSTYMMAKGHPASIIKNGRRCIRIGAEILAPACGMSTRTPLESIRSLAKAVLNQV